MDLTVLLKKIMLNLQRKSKSCDNNKRRNALVGGVGEEVYLFFPLEINKSVKTT